MRRRPLEEAFRHRSGHGGAVLKGKLAGPEDGGASGGTGPALGM